MKSRERRVLEVEMVVVFLYLQKPDLERKERETKICWAPVALSSLASLFAICLVTARDYPASDI
jgi:hypothetical protein